MNMNTKTIKNNNKDDINIIGIFCIVDDGLKNLGLKDDVRVQASNSNTHNCYLSFFILRWQF